MPKRKEVTNFIQRRNVMSMRIVWILHVILKKNRIPINRFDIVI